MVTYVKERSPGNAERRLVRIQGVSALALPVLNGFSVCALDGCGAGLAGLQLAFGEVYFLPASGTDMFFVEFV